jgi:hypothetical protein
MAISLETTKPLSFNEWTELNSTNFILNYDAYLEYLKLWYANRKELSNKKTISLRQNYIELLQDLTYFFTDEEKELFLILLKQFLILLENLKKYLKYYAIKENP